jgi:predicted RecA/RadA family phage recombinase
MATNELYDRGEQLSLAATDPATPASGDPVLVGQISGVALTAEDSAGNTTIKMVGVFTLSVRGVDGGGNSAVAVGDILYYVAADTPKLSKKTTGVRYGYALGTVSGGATTTIPVKLGY